MYPKVKVRGLAHDDEYERYYHQGRSPLLGLKDFNSLFDRGFCSTTTANEHKDISPQLVAKVPKCYTPASFSPQPSSNAKGVEANEKQAKEENGITKPLIRASPIPRPRAVLSSPVNDEIIGSKTKSKVERHSNLKGRDHSSTGETKSCKSKVIVRHLTNQSPARKGEEFKDGEKGKGSIGRGASPVPIRVRRQVTAKH